MTVSTNEMTKRILEILSRAADDVRSRNTEPAYSGYDEPVGMKKYNSHVIHATSKPKDKKMKFKEKDLVTFELCKDGADVLNALGAIIVGKIVKHEHGPFDWAHVEPGMAFKHKTLDWDYIYVGPNFGAVRDKYKHYFFVPERGGMITEIRDLRRAPENDIEVLS